MPKRPVDERGGGRTAKLPSRERRHLYLVLDDWELGYSIRKVDLSLSADALDVEHSHLKEDEDNAVDRTKQRLPPAVFRLEAPHAHSGLFTSFGTKIMFLGRHSSPWGSAPLFDVRTRSLTSIPLPESEPNPYCSAYLQVDGKFFLLDDTNFEMLQPHPLLDRGPAVGWSWLALPEPSYHDVVSYVMHPDERTIFVSMVKQSLVHTKLATLSFDPVSSKWTRHGAWGLPFKGRGYFDHNLDAWVGLSCGDLGYLCACKVLSANAHHKQPPASKLSKEKLFCVDPVEKHIGATLVYIGGGSRFCLVQCLFIDGSQGGTKETQPEHLRYLLRVTTFLLKYDENGDLRVTKHCLVGCYQLLKKATVYYDHLEKPVAFWL